MAFILNQESRAGQALIFHVVLPLQHGDCLREQDDLSPPEKTNQLFV